MLIYIPLKLLWKEYSLFIPGRCVQLKSDDFVLKYGEIHPRTLEKFELGYPAIGGEIVWIILR